MFYKEEVVMSMTAKLVVEEGTLKGLILTLEDGDQWVIGRDPDACQLLIEDASVSRKHLLCKTSSEGIIAENLSHTNPTEINNKPLEKPYLLQNHDIVKIGDIIFHFHTDVEQKSGEEDLNIPQEKESEEDISRFAPKAEPKIDLEQEEEEELLTPVSEEEAFEDLDTIFEEEPANQNDFAEINFGFLDNGRWLLKVVSGPNNGAEFPIQSGASYLIGTDPNLCDIVFQDASVSRQHARITLSADDILTIEDLNSRNGTIIDGVVSTGSQTLSPNALVTIGHTSFTVFDREGVMETIVSPLMPAIVKALTEEKKGTENKSEGVPQPTSPSPQVQEANHTHTLGAFILIAILTGIFIVVGISTSTLFKTEALPVSMIGDTDQILEMTLAPFPNIKYTFNKTTGQLLLIGHVLTPFDRNQLLSSLQGLSFIKTVDDKGIVIDEYVWREINQIIEQHPQWKGISVTAPSAGHFIVTGALKKRAQAYDLNDYLGANFPYPNLIENQVVVEEDIVSSVENLLYTKGLKNLSVGLTNGDVIISGNVPLGGYEQIEALIPSIKEIRGVHNVHNMTIKQAEEQSFIDVSNKYRISGISNHNNKLSVVINGRILMTGDQLDGMNITQINPNSILLEKEGIQYRINFNK